MLSPEFIGAQQNPRHAPLALRALAAVLSILLLSSCGGSSAPLPTVSMSSTHLSLTSTQQVSISATTDDPAGVVWSTSPPGGKFSLATSHSGETVTLTAPSTAGIYAVIANSASDPGVFSSATLAVTDLPGVYTYHNDLARTGANSSEYALSPSNVNSASFGKLFSCTVDGPIYGQPLWAANLTINGKLHNVVYVATGHDSIFAFDADMYPCEQLWSATLLDSAYGASAGERAVPSAGPGSLVGLGGANMTPETGITGTPVIDPASKTLYLVSKSVDSAGETFYQRLHAIDLATGTEKPGSPITINATYPGTGDGGSTVTFNAKTQLQRPGLTLVNGTIVIA